MRIQADNAPSSTFTLEPISSKPNYLLARFYENVTPYTETRDGVTISGYEYDEYDLTLLKTATIEEEIESNYDMYFSQAKLNEIQHTPYDPLLFHSVMSFIGEATEYMKSEINEI